MLLPILYIGGVVVAIFVVWSVRASIEGGAFQKRILGYLPPRKNRKADAFFLEWINNPDALRREQRDLAVTVLKGLGATEAQCGHLVVQSVLRSWKDARSRFGHHLAEGMEALIPECNQGQRQEAFQELKAKLTESDLYDPEVYQRLLGHLTPRDEAEARIVDWVNDPNRRRREQQDTVVMVLKGWDLSEAQCAKLILRCVLDSQKEERNCFGQHLARWMEIGVLLCDTGGDVAQEARLREQKTRFERFKADLIELDYG